MSILKSGRGAIPALQPKQEEKVPANKKKAVIESIRAWQNQPTPQNAAAMLKQLDPYIDQAIFAHLGQTPSPIIRCYAKNLALRALKRYDPSTAALSTFLVTQLQGLRRYYRKISIPLYVPERRQTDYMLISEARVALEHKLNRPPSVEEIADHLKMPVSRVVRSLNVPPYVAESVATPEMSQIADTTKVVDKRAPSFSRFDYDIVYDDLESPIDKNIMEWRLGLYGKPKLTNQEIAKRLNLSPGAITQRWKAIESKLMEVSQINPLKGITHSKVDSDF
jgi:DNA-directed RNA polymerase specialized sigma subunit